MHDNLCHVDVRLVARLDFIALSRQLNLTLNEERAESVPQVMLLVEFAVCAASEQHLLREVALA